MEGGRLRNKLSLKDQGTEWRRNCRVDVADG